MKIRTSFQQRTTLATLAGFMIAVPAVLAAIGTDKPIALPGRPDQKCAISTPSFKQLAMITSKSGGGFQCLGVSVDGDTVKAIRLEKHDLESMVRHPDPEQVKVVEIPATKLESRHGAVLDGVPGHDAIVLRGHFFAPPGKMELSISYLYNGITGEYHGCPLVLDWTPDSGWRLVNRFDQTISHIVVRLHQVSVIGVIGIADLEGACTAHDQRSVLDQP